MTTYSSVSRRLHDLIPTSLNDSYVISQEIAPHVVVQAYTPDVDTLAGGLTWTGVMDAISEGPQGHAEGSVPGRGVPVWSIACVFAGLVLMALAAVMLTVVIPLQHGL